MTDYASESWFLTVYGRVQARDALKDFDDFYQTHLPRLLTLGFYGWARRYYSKPDAEGVRGHIAVYEFNGEENIAGNLGAMSDATPSLVVPEVERWSNLAGLSDSMVSIFDQTSGPWFSVAVMEADTAIAVSYAGAAVGKEAEFEQLFAAPTNPESLGAGCVSLLRFRRHDHEALVHPPASDHLSVALFEGEPPADPLLGVPSELHAEGGLTQTFYPMSKHWRLPL
jgi:hypothetical protein